MQPPSRPHLLPKRPSRPRQHPPLPKPSTTPVIVLCHRAVAVRDRTSWRAAMKIVLRAGNRNEGEQRRRVSDHPPNHENRQGSRWCYPRIAKSSYGRVDVWRCHREFDSIDELELRACGPVESGPTVQESSVVREVNWIGKGKEEDKDIGVIGEMKTETMEMIFGRLSLAAVHVATLVATLFESEPDVKSAIVTAKELGRQRRQRPSLPTLPRGARILVSSILFITINEWPVSKTPPAAASEISSSNQTLRGAKWSRRATAGATVATGGLRESSLKLSTSASNETREGARKHDETSSVPLAVDTPNQDGNVLRERAVLAGMPGGTSRGLDAGGASVEIRRRPQGHRVARARLQATLDARGGLRTPSPHEGTLVDRGARAPRSRPRSRADIRVVEGASQPDRVIG
ncbi:hypothetical protein THAOC_15675 [Thalassiosira oceanica]|uniref:Uncharacterized protein n=1 Tax=Thalassiosira oceanica TaxID=159749 RepID=K0SC44_THAOC|nr:hypothetical protein THAOC_15675 [Thalassiosira oceanica]|eukprot:EJK63653.1 hypothetical protein THAOC_15675 [Thalassiosira oceanica]